MTYSRRPKIVKAGIVVLDPEQGTPVRTIALQFNPETLTRSLEIVGASESNRSEPLRLMGPPVETLTLEVFLDASDQLEYPKQNQSIVRSGLHGPLAVLETLVYPRYADVMDNQRRSARGELEIIPMERYLTLFVWGRRRVLPVRITQVTINEEDFDADLNPIRARVSLGLRVLSVDDLGFDHRGGSLFLRHFQLKEKFAQGVESASLETLGPISID